MADNYTMFVNEEILDRATNDEYWLVEASRVGIAPGSRYPIKLIVFQGNNPLKSDIHAGYDWYKTQEGDVSVYRVSTEGLGMVRDMRWPSELRILND